MLPAVAVILYFLLIWTLEAFARSWFDHAKECILMPEDDTTCQGIWDSEHNLVLPWWISVYDHITYRPLIR